jgi:hypothetical protein
LSSKSFDALDLKTLIHKKKYCRSKFLSKLQNGGPLIYLFGTCTAISQSILTYKPHFGLAKLSTSIFLRPKIIQLKMKSKFKMAILHLSIRSSEPCIFAIFKPTIFKFWILIKDYMRINDKFGFYETSSISSEIWSRILPNIFQLIFHHFSRIFPNLLKFRVDPIFWANWGALVLVNTSLK